LTLIRSLVQAFRHGDIEGAPGLFSPLHNHGSYQQHAQLVDVLENLVKAAGGGFLGLGIGKGTKFSGLDVKVRCWMACGFTITGIKMIADCGSALTLATGFGITRKLSMWELLKKYLCRPSSTSAW
jgi:hypothetical protein